MKRTFILTLLALMVLSACKKEKVDPLKKKETSPYYVKFKVDGVQKIYKGESNGVGLGSVDAEKRKFGFVLLSNEIGKDNGKNILSIILGDDREIATGISYHDSPLDGPGSIMDLWYRDESGTVYGSNFTLRIYKNKEPDAIVHFSEIKPGYIKGTFNATVYDIETVINYDPVPLKSKKITDGEFFLPRD